MIAWIKKLLGHDVPPWVQFVKYAVCGGLATALSIVVFFLLGWKLLPCLTPSDPIVRLFHLELPFEVSEQSRWINAAVCNTIGFVISNLFCYALNRLFVFRSGRHVWYKELALFFLGSGLAFVLGTGMQTGLIRTFGIETTRAFGTNVVVAVLINYAMRKWVVFKG
ncbi:MAG: GtrA family protein [Kiritimatiellae bacterium]|nr:GtrA family protein [Kiritimatiellia bacterium]